MDNLVFTKTLEDGTLIGLRMEANCEFASAYQIFWSQDVLLTSIAKEIIDYSYNSSVMHYIEFGIRKGDHTPPSVRLLPADRCGHVKIEVDLEIDDDGETRKHRCCFYVNSDLGCLERLGHSLQAMVHGVVGMEVALHH